MNYQLIFPLAFYVFYIWLIGLFLFMSRSRAVRSGKLRLQYFKTYTGEPPPEKALVLGRHYDNQFQLPMIFLSGGILHFTLAMSNGLTVALAWAFVASRIVHSRIHLSSNRVQYRALAYAVGWFIMLAFWGQLVFFALEHVKS
jgi:hypothetical protein